VDALRLGFAFVMALFGICALAGWATAFRSRLYLAPIGLAFLALGGAAGISQEGPVGLRIALYVIAVLAFAVGAWLAVAEVRREMQAIQEQRRGLEQEMEEYLARLQAQHREKGPPEDAEQNETQS